MSFGTGARSRASRSRVTLVGAVAVVCAALLGVFVDRSSATSADVASEVPNPVVTTTPRPPMAGAPRSPMGLPREQQRGLGVADGVLPAGVTVFDDAYPGVARLDSSLLGALRRAASDAARDRVTLYVKSGWRSPTYQQELLDRAMARYGSEAEAARWVARPDRSAHVSGDAVDLADHDGPTWLSKHGAGYGLCRIYRNEPWHFELRPDAAGHGCPAMYVDAAHDPRMQS